MRYLTILDISKCPCYSNVNARLLYLHLACNVSYQNNALETQNCVLTSYRQLSVSVGLSLSATRHALGLLVRDKLIEVNDTKCAQNATQNATQITTQSATHRTTQLTTQIRLLTYSDLQGGSDTVNDTVSDTPNDTPNDTVSDTVSAQSAHTLYNKIKQNNNISLSVRVRDVVFSRAQDICTLLQLPGEQAKPLVTAFIQECELKNVQHKDEDDCFAHCVDWCRKRMIATRSSEPRQSKQTKAAKEKADITATQIANANYDRLLREQSEAYLYEHLEHPDNITVQEWASLCQAKSENNASWWNDEFKAKWRDGCMDLCKSNDEMVAEWRRLHGEGLRKARQQLSA